MLSTPPRKVSPSTLSSKKKDVAVLMLRHGERADEVKGAIVRTRREPRNFYIDPPLTEEGHEQAREAFEQILPTLKGKRVAVFVSPLRRTMATASMIGAAVAATDDNDVEFVVPRRSGEDNTNCVLGNGSVPLVVANGLSDCAAQIVRLGGALSAVEQGYVDGAATASNDLCSPNSPLMNMIDESILIRKVTKSSVQFFKELKKNGDWFYDGRIIPMSPRLGGGGVTTSSSIDGTDSTDHEHRSPDHSSTATRNPSNARKRSNKHNLDDRSNVDNEDSFRNTINRIARLTAEANCDACVVVTHREGIRDTARTILRKGRVRFSTPYCCVGKFTASVWEDVDHVEWAFEGISPYQQYASMFEHQTS